MPSHRLFKISNNQQPVTIRVWHDTTVVAVLDVSPDGGGSTFSGAPSPLDAALDVDIELDPWAGLVRVNRAGMPSTGSNIVPIVPALDDEPPF